MVEITKRRYPLVLVKLYIGYSMRKILSMNRHVFFKKNSKVFEENFFMANYLFVHSS